MNARNQKESLEVDRILGQLIDIQATSAAYMRGKYCVLNLTIGDKFTTPEDAAVKRGYARHTQEHRLFLDGYNDTVQDYRVGFVTDSNHIITGLWYHPGFRE